LFTTGPAPIVLVTLITGLLIVTGAVAGDVTFIPPGLVPLPKTLLVNAGPVPLSLTRTVNVIVTTPFTLRLPPAASRLVNPVFPVKPLSGAMPLPVPFVTLAAMPGCTVKIAGVGKVRVRSSVTCTPLSSVSPVLVSVTVNGTS